MFTRIRRALINIYIASLSLESWSTVTDEEPSVIYTTTIVLTRNLQTFVDIHLTQTSGKSSFAMTLKPAVVAVVFADGVVLARP